MRQLSQAAIDALTAERVVGGKVIVRDERLRFDDMRGTQVDYLGGDKVHAYDDCVYSGNVLRIAVVEETGVYKLWFNYITDFQSIWPNWVDTGVQLMASSRPGIYDGRVVYLKSDGDLAYREFDGASFGLETIIETVGVGATADIAMVNLTTFYMHYTPGATSNHGFIIRSVIGGSKTAWSGRTTGAAVYGALDAVEYEGDEYVYFSDQNGQRAHGLKYADGMWGQPFPLIPLDIVDDTSLFRLGHANVINGKVYITGVLKRPSAPGMHIYMVGPEDLTMGRDLYIAKANTEAWQYTYQDATTIMVEAVAGQMHLIGDEVWYLGPLIAYKAEATQFVGYDNAALETEIVKINNIQLQSTTNIGGFLGFLVDPGVSHAALREGSIVEVIITINGQDITMGEYSIDAVNEHSGPRGEGLEVAATLFSIKNMEQWQSDADFDWWSQTKQAARPYDLEEVIRADGLWEQVSVPEGNVIALKDLNAGGVLYSASHASEGAVAKGMFWYPTDAILDPVYGVITNYAHQEYETDADLPDSANLTRMGHWGIAVIYSPTNHNGSPGLSVEYWHDDSRIEITSYALTIPADTWHWLSAEYIHGALRIRYRLDSDTSWTEIANAVLTFENEASSYHGLTVLPMDVLVDEKVERGRSALYVENQTLSTPAFGLSSRDTLLGVDDNSVHAIGDIIRLGVEQLEITGKSVNVASPGNMTVQEGYTFKNSPHWSEDPNGFDGHEIYLGGTGTAARDAYDGMALVVVDGSRVGRTFTITDYDKDAPDQWEPTGTYTSPDKWIDHVGDTNYGSWVSSNAQRVFVEESPGGANEAGSIVRIVPAYVVSRGMNDTDATTHQSGLLANLHTASSVYCRDFNHFSLDPDYSIEDMARMISRKAGIQDINVSQLLGTTVTKAVAGWDLENEVTATEQQSRGFIVNFDLQDNGIDGGFGVAYALRKENSVYSGGRVVMIYGDRVDFFNYVTPTPTLIESVSLPVSYTQGEAYVSVDEEFVSVWVGGNCVATFVDRNVPVETTELIPIPQWYAGIVMHNEVTVDVVWSELHSRVDNFVLTMGATGVQGISQLIGDKRIFISGSNALHLFRTRDIVNAGDPYSFTVESTSIQSEEDLATRVRVEGAKVAEQFDEDAMREHGNLFFLVNGTELLYYGEHYREALDILEESVAMGGTLNIIGTVDPRIEGGDIIEVGLPSGTKSYIVDSAMMTFSVQEDNITFSMQIEAHHA